MDPLTINHPEVARWIGKGKVLTSHWSPRAENLFIVTLDDKGNVTLLRAFKSWPYVGERVQVSQDIRSDDVKDIVTYLIQNRD